MKNLWILNHYAQEPGGAGGTRHYSLAQHLLSHNWRASIIAASVELNTGRQRLVSHEQKRIDNLAGVPFLWVRTPEYKGNGIGRIINMLTFAVRVLIPRVTRKLSKPDIIVGSSVHPFAAVSGAILAKRFQVPFVFEVRDLWPQTLINLSKLPEKSIAARALHTLEKWLYRRADRIVTLLPQARDYIVPLNVPAHKIIWIPNGVELNDYPPHTSPEESNLFTLMYFGAHGQANGLDNLIKAMAELYKHPKMRHVRVRMIGDGPLKPELIQLTKQLNLNNVEFEDPIPKKDIPSLASEADAFVITVKNLPQLYRYGISMNKLFDYLAAARPIIIASAASNNPVDEAKAGITVPPEDPKALAKAIVKLTNMPIDKRIAMGIAGRTHAENNYAFEVLAARLASTLDELTENTNQ